MSAADAAPIRITRILVVDYSPLLYEALARALEGERNLCVKWSQQCAREALDLCLAHRPEMAIVGMSLLDRCEIDLVGSMHDRWQDMRILVLSGRDDWSCARQVLRAGASGFAIKFWSIDRIVEAIRVVNDGRLFLSEELRAYLTEQGYASGTNGSAKIARLSQRESEIFELIGKGFKKGEIARHVGRSVNTVEAHRANIRRKLEVRSSAEMARLAFLHSQENARPQYLQCPLAIRKDGCPFNRVRTEQAGDGEGAAEHADLRGGRSYGRRGVGGEERAGAGS